MKRTAKVFVVIGVILRFVLIFPIVLGVISYKKLNKASTKSYIKVWALLTLFFVSIFAGIIMLCMTDNDLLYDDEKTNFIKHNSIVISDIEYLVKMKEENLMTEAEFVAKKEDLLKELW